jgi:amino acid permease
MELPSQRRLNIVICSSISFALVIFSAVAIEGYRTYGSAVRGDILLNYPENKHVTFLRVCIAFMLALHYPLQLDPSRRCISSLVMVIIKWWRRKKEASSIPSAISGKCLDGLEFRPEEVEDESLATELDEPKHISSYIAMVQNNAKKEQSESDGDDSKGTIPDDRLFYIITFTFLLLSFTLATIVDDLGIILALVGATGSTLVSYILPGLIYVKVCPHRDMSLVMAYTQLLLGIVMMPFALYFILTNKVRH